MPEKLSVGELQQLLKASYDTNLVNVGDKFIIDKALSGPRVKVFTVAGSKDVIVTHRGSQNVYEWMDNVNYAAGRDISTSGTYRTHKNKQRCSCEKVWLRKYYECWSQSWWCHCHSTTQQRTECSQY